MPNKPPLAKKYQYLTPHERFCLALAASGRRDELELNRLRSPHSSHIKTKEDVECADRFLAGHLIVMGWAQFWEDAYRQCLLYSMAGDDVRARLSKNKDNQSIIPLILDLIATYMGFAWFCESIDCDPLLVLEAYWPPLAERVKNFLEVAPFHLLDGHGQPPDEQQKRVFETAAHLDILLSAGWPFERSQPSEFVATEDESERQHGDAKDPDESTEFP